MNNIRIKKKDIINDSKDDQVNMPFLFNNQSNKNKDLSMSFSFNRNNNNDITSNCKENKIKLDNIHTATWENYYIKTEDIHSKYTETIRAIPISISYQLDVYARYAKEADLLMRNLVFNIINYPGFTISIPKANLIHTARIVLGDSIDDNSNVPERFVEGNFTRLTANITVDNARLWDTRKLRNAEIEIVLDDTYEQEYDIYFPDYNELEI